MIRVRLIYVAGLASMSHSSIGVQRGVATGLETLSLNGKARSISYDVQAETGVNMPLGNGLLITPRAALRYSRNRISGYRERRADAALLVDTLNDRSLEARFGARLSGTTAIGRNWSFTPQVSADMVKSLSGGSTDLTVRFAQAPGLAFTLPGFDHDQNWTEVKGGMQLSNGPLSFGASLETSINRSDYSDNRVMADFTLRF